MRLPLSIGLAAFAAFPALAAPDPGERAFGRCAACHAVDPEETDLPGPNLAGVVGRRAAQGQFAYSPAMKAAAAKGLTWTEAQLDLYLRDPQKTVPRTSMMTPGVANPGDRAAIIAWLKKHSSR